MDKDTFSDIGILVLISLLLIFEFTPYGILMIPMELAIIVCFFIAIVLFITTFFWRPKPLDERDLVHKHKAGEISFLIGSLILTLGIVIELLLHSLDKFLIIALAAMVCTKIITRMILRSRE